MPDTFTPDQLSQTPPVPPVSGATPCAKKARKAKAPRHKADTLPDEIRTEVWMRAGEIDRDAHQVGTIFGMAWEIMEEISTHAVDAQARGSKALLTASDRLYVLLNGVEDRVGTMRKASEVITRLTSRSTDGAANLGDDAVSQRHREYRAAEATVNAPEHTADESPEIDAFHAAQERFIAEPVTSLLGVLLKLELLNEVEDLEHEGDGIKNSIILGLLKDLRTALGRTE